MYVKFSLFMTQFENKKYTPKAYCNIFLSKQIKSDFTGGS